MEAEHSTRSDAGQGVAWIADLEALTGRELPLEDYLAVLRRTAQNSSAFTHFGTCLVTCSDERQADLRRGFDTEVAMALQANGATSAASPVGAFVSSNLGGRVEQGVMELVDDHFTVAEDSSRKLLIVLVSSHLGVLAGAGASEYGVLERLGRRSACCGALDTLLDIASGAEVPNVGWVEDLVAGLGTRRMEELAELERARSPIQLAVVHAVLQAEALLSELWGAPPASGTTVLLLSSVSLNRADGNGMLPVACHLLESEGGTLRAVGGQSLPATPSELVPAEQGGLLEVRADSDEQLTAVAEQAGAAALSAEVARDLRGLCQHSEDEGEAVRECEARARAALDALRADPGLGRIHARPLLRSFFRDLTQIASGAGISALLVPTGAGWPRADDLRRIRDAGPETPRVLREIGMQIQQLDHREAQLVLESLLSGDRPGAGD